MVKQPKENRYLKDVHLISKMKEVFEMRYVQHLCESEILSLTGLKRTRYYEFLRTFAAEHPELAEQMKKKGSDVIPEDYKKLLEEVSTLKSQLKKEKLRADFYEEMVAFGKDVYGIDLKKAGTK
jgi:hypothetical protein